MSSVGNRSYEFAIVTSLTSDVRAGAAERARAERVHRLISHRGLAAKPLVVTKQYGQATADELARRAA